MEDMNNIFGLIEERELNQTEKIQYVEALLREVLRDNAFSRSLLFEEAMTEDTNFLVRGGETKFKKFKSDDRMYICLPETVYEHIKDMSDFEKYHYIDDTANMLMAADEYRELDEDGNTILEAELIDKAVKKVEDYTGDILPIKDEIEYDDYEQPVSLKDDETIFKPKKFSKVKSDGSTEEDEDDKAANESGNEDGEESIQQATVNAIDINDDVEQEKQEQQKIMQQQYEAEYTSQSITDEEQKVIDDLKDSTFYYGRYNEKTMLSSKDKAELKKYVNDIAKALRGYNGKIKRINPAKRLSSKDICSDISDKIYVGNSYVDGKFIDQNLVIDGSGSMSGKPMYNAMKLCYVFNKLAQEELVEGHIILSESHEYKVLEMPVKDEILDVLGSTGGSEGLYKTIIANKNILQNKNMICISDSSITDEPLSKEFWSKNKINALGVYVNEDVKDNNLQGYDTNMKRWFGKSIVRNNFEDMVQKLIQLGLKASTK